MSLETIGLIALVVFLILVLSGLPVVFALLLLGIAGYAIMDGWNVMLSALATNSYLAIHSYGLTVAPLFIVMGEIMNQSGLGAELLDVANKWVRKLPGGLASAVVVANAFFAAMSGVAMASSALFSRIAVPEMKRHGYNVGLAAGAVAGAGPLAAMIPPSVLMVIYAMLTEASLSQLLIAGVLPGIMLTLIMVTTVTIICTVKPSLAPRIAGTVTWKERIASTMNLLPAILVVVSILGSIYGGIATATEAAALGVLTMILITVVKRRLTLKSFYKSLIMASVVYGAIQIIFVGGRVFGHMMMVSGLARSISNAIVGLGLSPILIIIMFMLMYIILGMFLDAITMLLVTLPIMMPVVYGLGFSDVWFGILVVCCCELGAITPPFGVCLFATKGGVAGTDAEDITVMEIARGSMPFMFSYIIGLAILVAFPIIPLFLPGLMRTG
ncbi:MAG: TRAP transporter large permease [Chloroflexi bacterium]|nr:TRAP transporter large permease [Chloroflexota bacterium]